jgi:hypothetical protein
MAMAFLYGKIKKHKITEIITLESLNSKNLMEKVLMFGKMVIFTLGNG